MRISFFLLAVCFVLICSCQSNSETEIYEGTKIELDYRGVEEIKDGSWIKIDRWKFMHFRDRRKASETPFSLPATEMVFDSVDTGRKVRTEVNSKSIPMHLSRYLIMISMSDSLLNEHEPAFDVVKPALASVAGRLVVQKSDSSLVRIEIPKSYPARISVLNE